MWKRRRKRRSGRDQEDERKRIAEDVSLVIFRWHQNRGGDLHRGMNLAGVPLTGQVVSGMEAT
jgi:hypothetical protein